ncbi:hypothetical protein F5146DRAFT_1133906 [Armillaria mellea]|nr:hypothetical protein F5146DRAFT_1133906 [Armillaria mellea]
MSFTLDVELDMYDPFRLCSTFMAEDHHTLSLSIRTPSIENQTNKVSWPVFTWYDRDLEILSVEVEEIFGVRISIQQDSWMMPVSQTVLTTIHDFNADYSFNPARGGADICEYFRWPLMEIRDICTGDWTPLYGTVASESTSVISGDRDQTLSESTESPLDNALEVEHAGEASTKTGIANAVQIRDVKSSYGPWVFIVMLIMIGVILSYFVVQAWYRLYVSPAA